jgi:hypothetical protein
MTPAEFEAAVDAAIARRPEAFEGEFVRRAPKLSGERLAEIELDRGNTLPAEYKHFLTRYGGGDFQFTDVSSPDPDSEWSLWVNYDYIPDGEKRLLPFANNGCGDYYCFKLDDGRCSREIWWADHEQGYELSPAEYVDFYDFIVRVALTP